MNIIDKSIYDGLELMSLDYSGWYGDSELFPKLINEIKPEIIIEVGTWKGQSAINMAQSAKNLNLTTKIYCVDTWLGGLQLWDEFKDSPDTNLLQKNGYPQIYYQFLSNVVHCNLQDVIIPFPNTSSIAFRYFYKRGIFADMIYIDGSHDEDDVYSDLNYYYQLLKIGGVIFGDDFDWGGVRSSVERFCQKNELKFEIIDNHFWLIKK